MYVSNIPSFMQYIYSIYPIILIKHQE
jgi:hypothetical protein